MRTKPAYTECRIYVDGIPDLQVGEYVVTAGGSAYLVQSMRQNKNRAQRRHLVCLRWPIDKIPADATVHTLQWYRRTKRATTLRHLAGARP